MILACGEALIDMLPRTTGSGEAAFAPYPGGAVFNTAIALGRLGAPASFFSGISSDLFGQMLTEALTASNVDASPVAVSDRPTTLAFVQLVDGHASYAFYDENTAGRMLTGADLPQVTADALFFGGISLVVEPCASVYEALMLREAPHKAVMIDPNIRPGFIRDEALYRARLDAMLPVADIVKISDEDLAWIARDRSPEAVTADLLDRGVKLLCITEGARGATAHWSGGTLFVEASKATVVDTVGAGDTFNAGVLASLHAAGKLTKAALEGLDADTVREALTLGARAAAITVARAGANPPWANEL